MYIHILQMDKTTVKKCQYNSLFIKINQFNINMPMQMGSKYIIEYI